MDTKSLINYFLNLFNLRLFIPYPRPFQKYNLLDEKRKMVGVEIGVLGGENSLSLLKRSNIKKLYLVDPYKKYDQINFCNLQKEKKKAEKRLNKFKNIKWIFKDSMTASKEIPNDLDFVYIDGDHSYEYVKKDIEHYYSKIKKGGLLAGDDFPWRDVNKAVIEFVDKHKLELNAEKDDWWIVKK